MVSAKVNRERKVNTRRVLASLVWCVVLDTLRLPEKASHEVPLHISLSIKRLIAIALPESKNNRYSS